MGVKVAIQMDPIGSIDIDADSTFRLALEAAARGHDLFYYHVEDLMWREGRLLASGHDLTVRRRLQVYLDQTAPLVDFYSGHPAGLIRIQADRDVDDIYADFTRAAGGSA